MKTSVQRKKILRALKVALRTFTLRIRLHHVEACYASEVLSSRQASANAHYYKMKAGMLKHELERTNHALK